MKDESNLRALTGSSASTKELTCCSDCPDYLKAMASIFLSTAAIYSAQDDRILPIHRICLRGAVVTKGAGWGRLGEDHGPVEPAPSRLGRINLI